MRTVSDGNITQALIDTQSDATKIPYIYIYINSTDYSSRLLYLEHHEEPYRERATIGLTNRDGALDGLDLTGCEFEIGYGYDSSDNGGSSTDKVDTATLWVKSVQRISQGGERIYQIHAEGMWGRLRNEKLLPGVVTWKAETDYVEGQYTSPATPNGRQYVCTVAGTSGTDEPDPWEDGVTDGGVTWSDAGPTLPYSNRFERTHTIQELMEIVVLAMGWTWLDIDDTDGIIDDADHSPVFEIGASGYEPGAAVLYRLIWTTKVYLRSRPSTTIQPVFRPETDDGGTLDITYYSDQNPKFDEWDYQISQMEPNSIVVLCNADPSTGLFGEDSFVGVASNQYEIDKYFEVIDIFYDGNITDKTIGNERADAILWRIEAETGGGRLLLPFHDCRVELFDRIGVEDNRK